MKARKTVLLVVFTLSLLMLGIAACKHNSRPSSQPDIGPQNAQLRATSKQTLAAVTLLGALPITISSGLPAELNPGTGTGFGAPATSMQQAAAFAWQEFIALNWPAVAQTGAFGTRDTPDNNCKFSDPRCTGPLVWETFRGKAETFPGAGTPAGYPGGGASASYGYDAPPTYTYQSAVPACPSTAPPAGPVWINLDETDEITLASMYAGTGPTQSPDNSAPQLIRFLAKSNRSEYTYVAANEWYKGVPSAINTATLAYLAAQKASPPAGSSNLVSLPNGAVEIKAGWRVLTQQETSSGRFVTAAARYYEDSPLPGCYRVGTFGLVALHIIQKTPSAPYFIYATFEQADNILSATGARVEDEDGRVNQPMQPCRGDETVPCPTTPAVVLQDTPIVSSSRPPIPPQVNLVPSGAAYCGSSASTPPPNQLYYQNTAGHPGTPNDGFICINSRDNPIPDPIIASNQSAHSAIKAYLETNNISRSPWLSYKLINVQYKPIDKTAAGVYTGNDPNSGQNASSYHLANIVVETNRTLQLFSGSLLSTGPNSDYDAQFKLAPSGNPQIHRNMYYGGNTFNMGGCMGCHGSQGQHQGGDFSVILAKGRVLHPEGTAPPTAKGAAIIPRNRKLAFK